MYRHTVLLTDSGADQAESERGPCSPDAMTTGGVALRVGSNAVALL